MNIPAYKILPGDSTGNTPADNFEAIFHTAPNLYALLRDPPRAAGLMTIKRLKGDELFGQFENATYRIIDPQPPNIPSCKDKPIFLLGVGNGQIINHYLSAIDNPILIIEPEINLLVEVLNHFQWHRSIRTGRLCILAPDVRDPVLSQISLQACIADIQHQFIQNNGNAYWVAGGSFELNRPFFNTLEQSVSFFADFSNFVADISELNPPADAPNDVTVVSPQCRIFDDVAHCFRQLGLKTQLWRVPDASGIWSLDKWQQAFTKMQHPPSKVFLFRNRTMLETEKAAERYHWEYFMPGNVVSWWWDIPNVASKIDFDHQAENNINFAFAKDIIAHLPGRAEWLPPGALTPFTTCPISLTSPPKPDLPTTFVGQSRIQLITSNVKILHQALQYLCGRKGSFLSKDIERQHHILGLYKYLQTKKDTISRLIGSIETARPNHAYYLDYIFQMILTGLFRMAAVLTIKKASLPVMVFGDEGWVKSGVVDESAYKGLIAPENLPALYQRSAVNLNLNFMQVSSTVNPKVLDACAAGGTVLTDFRPELTTLFPDPDIRPFHFKTLKELPDKVNTLSRSDLTAHRIKLLIYTRRAHSLQERVRHLAKRLMLV